MSSSYRRLGEILVQVGFLLEEDLAKALSLQKSTSARLGEIVVSMGWAREVDLIQCLAEQYNYEVVDCKKIKCTPQALSLINDHNALRHLVLPVETKDGYLHCVVGDPINVVPIDTLRSAQKYPLKISLAPPSELRDVIIQHYFNRAGKSCPTAPARKQKIDNQADRVSLLRALDFENEQCGKRRKA